MPAGKSSLSVELAASPRVTHRANNTAAIYYGPLLYALAIEHDITSHEPINYRSQQPLPANTTDPLGRTQDFQLTPKNGTIWNIAIDPQQIEIVKTNKSNSGLGELDNPIWDLGAPPVELRVKAVEIDWPVVRDSPADPGTFEVTRKGEPFWTRFVPYGSSKLHMALLPVMGLDDA